MTWEDVKLIPYRGGRRSIPPILECAWRCGNDKFGLGYQQHSNNCSSMMHSSDPGFRCYIHELRQKCSSEFQ
jgi:hypothetical protein